MGIADFGMGRIRQIETNFSCHSVVNGSDAPTSCGITYATNFVNFSNLRNFERTEYFLDTNYTNFKEF
jgi:hypothetical protein